MAVKKVQSWGALALTP